MEKIPTEAPCPNESIFWTDHPAFSNCGDVQGTHIVNMRAPIGPPVPKNIMPSAAADIREELLAAKAPSLSRLAGSGCRCQVFPASCDSSKTKEPLTGSPRMNIAFPPT